MRNLILVLIYFLTACSNSENVEPEMMTSAPTTTDFSKQKLLREAMFVNGGSYKTTGTAKIFENSEGKKTLVFENFKTDAGPDLRIYIAKDKALGGFVELSSKVENGNKSYAIPSTVDISQQNFVLIWCKQFSVLFGHAELK